MKDIIFYSQILFVGVFFIALILVILSAIKYLKNK